MATYKKKAKKNKNEQVSHIEDHSTTAEVFNTLDETASKSEQWIEKNSKLLFSILIGIIAVIAAYYTYDEFIQKPNEKEAADELAYPKSFFDNAQKSAVTVDSLYNLALDGADGKYGLLDIIDTYGSTDAGNIAKYMAGISYLKMRDYENAIKYLSDFSTDDEVLGALAKGNVGDAFSDLNQPKEALEYYIKASKFKPNDFTTPIYLFKAGNMAMDLGEFKKAEELFLQIKEKYSKSNEGQEIDAYINGAKLAGTK